MFFRWVKYKKGRKEKYKTEDSLKTAFEKLKKYSAGEISKATQIIENSIGMNYAGFFELKQSSIPTITPQDNKGVQAALDTFDRLKI